MINNLILIGPQIPVQTWR